MSTLNLLRRLTVVLIVSAGTLGAQTIDIPDSDAASGHGLTSDPFGVTPPSSGYGYLLRIPGGFLDPTHPVINDFAFAAAATGTWSSSSVVFSVAHLPRYLDDPFAPAPITPTPLPSGPVGIQTSVIDSDSIAPTTVLDAAGSTYTYSFTANTWSPLGLGAGFRWNGRDDIGLFITFNDATGSSADFHTSANNPRGLTSMSNGSEIDGLKVRVVCSARTDSVEYQVNQPEAALTMRAVENDAYGNQVIRVGVEQVAHIDLESGLGGAPWDMLLGMAPLLSASNGARVLGDGQIVNVDLTDPTFMFMNGGFSTSPMPNRLSFSSSVPMALSMQLVLRDFTAPSGVALSQPVRLEIVDTPTAPTITSVNAANFISEGDLVTITGTGFNPSATCVFFDCGFATGFDTAGSATELTTRVGPVADDGVVTITLATGIGNRLPGMVATTSNGATIRILGEGALSGAVPVDSTTNVNLDINPTTVDDDDDVCFTKNGEKLEVDAPALPMGTTRNVHIHFKCADGMWFDFSFCITATGNDVTADDAAAQMRNYINLVVGGATATGTGDDVKVCKDAGGPIMDCSFGKIY